MKNTPQSARVLVGLVAVCALGFLGTGLLRWESFNIVRFGCFVVLSMLASRMRVSLPGLNSNMAVNLPFLLLAALELSLPEALMVAAASTAVQCLPKGGKSMSTLQVVFNVSLIVNAIGVGHVVLQRATMAGALPAKSILLLLAAVAFFAVDTLPVAIILGLAERVDIVHTWKEIAVLTAPFFLLSAGIATIAVTASVLVGWQIPLAIFPVMVVMYISYRRYFGEAAKQTMIAEAHVSMAD